MISMKEECVGINTANYMAKSKLLYQCSEDIWDNIERLSADGEKKKKKRRKLEIQKIHSLLAQDKAL